MKMSRYSVAALLLVSSLLLGVLVPGGPIETRSFSHIDPVVLGGFNTFLTTLSMTSLLLTYFVWNDRRWAYVASLASGVSYFGVYALDLARIFPISPDAMPEALLVIEVLGAILSIPLSVVALKAVLEQHQQPERLHHHELNDVLERQDVAIIEGRHASLPIVFFCFLLGISIITFATRSAMGL